ncbi:hypothetical protein ACCT28_36755 [Rhizobium ruizarguesonis]
MTEITVQSKIQWEVGDIVQVVPEVEISAQNGWFFRGGEVVQIKELALDGSFFCQEMLWAEFDPEDWDLNQSQHDGRDEEDECEDDYLWGEDMQSPPESTRPDKLEGLFKAEELEGAYRQVVKNALFATFGLDAGLHYLRFFEQNRVPEAEVIRVTAERARIKAGA